MSGRVADTRDLMIRYLFRNAAHFRAFLIGSNITTATVNDDIASLAENYFGRDPSSEIIRANSSTEHLHTPPMPKRAKHGR